MSKDYDHEKWVKFYKMAILGLERTKLRDRIEDTRVEMAARIVKLRDVPGMHAADQQAKLKPILEDQQNQIEAVWKDTSLSEDAKNTKKAEIKGATNTQIKALLDATQQESSPLSASNQRKTLRRSRSTVGLPCAGQSGFCYSNRSRLPSQPT